jgi:hypothetical protein
VNYVVDTLVCANVATQKDTVVIEYFRINLELLS